MGAAADYRPYRERNPLQKAELPDLKAACPEYAEANTQVLQDLFLRVEWP